MTLFLTLSLRVSVCSESDLGESFTQTEKKEAKRVRQFETYDKLYEHVLNGVISKEKKKERFRGRHVN